MAVKDYYVILGIPRDETVGGIRSAYRSLAKKLHPDRAGSTGTQAFQDLTEAYETLSDPDRRRRYDRALQDESPRVVGRARTARRPASGWSFVEPVSVPRDFGRIRPSFDELHETLLRNWLGAHPPKAETERALNVELVLTPEEARTGGRLPLEVPVFRPCGSCRRTGHDWRGLACPACDGRGVLEDTETIAIRIPPPVAHGSVYEASLRHLGVRGFLLRLHLLVGG